MMKKILYLISILLIAFGCGQNKPLKINYKSVKLESSLLWKISGNGLKAPSYLFGTEHNVGANFLEKLPYVIKHLKECDVVAGEISIDTTPAILNRDWIFKKDSLSREF